MQKSDVFVNFSTLQNLKTDNATFLDTDINAVVYHSTLSLELRGQEQYCLISFQCYRRFPSKHFENK